MSFAKQYGVGGFTEVVVIARNLDRQRETWTGWARYEEEWRGDTGAALNRFWGLPGNVSSMEALFAQAGNPMGRIRVVELSGITAADIRRCGRPWEGGGIYDVDIRVRDIEAAYDQLIGMGWQGFNEPIDYRMGAVRVKHGELIGPDGVVVALIERIEPPLGPDAGFDQVSHAFNSSQLVYEDQMDETRNFYTRNLGFECFLQTELEWSGTGGNNIFSLPHNLVSDCPAIVDFFHPEGLMSGCVETCAIRNIVGKDFAARAQPPNSGLVALRFPVRDLPGYAAAIEATGEVLTAPLQEIDIGGLGKRRVFAVASRPGNSRLEFYEDY